MNKTLSSMSTSFGLHRSSSSLVLLLLVVLLSGTRRVLVVEALCQVHDEHGKPVALKTTTLPAGVMYGVVTDKLVCGSPGVCREWTMEGCTTVYCQAPYACQNATLKNNYGTACWDDHACDSANLLTTHDVSCGDGFDYTCRKARIETDTNLLCFGRRACIGTVIPQQFRYELPEDEENLVGSGGYQYSPDDPKVPPEGSQPQQRPDDWSMNPNQKNTAKNDPDGPIHIYLLGPSSQVQCASSESGRVIGSRATGVACQGLHIYIPRQYKERACVGELSFDESSTTTTDEEPPPSDGEHMGSTTTTEAWNDAPKNKLRIKQKNPKKPIKPGKFENPDLVPEKVEHHHRHHNADDWTNSDCAVVCATPQACDRATFEFFFIN